MHGKDNLKWPDNKYYIGDFFEDKQCGKGHFKWPHGREY